MTDPSRDVGTPPQATGLVDVVEENVDVEVFPITVPLELELLETREVVEALVTDVVA